MTQYIGGGLRPQNGPWSCGNCDAYYFLLAADGAALQKQLDEQINKVAGWKRFEVLVDAVAITFQRIEDLRSTAADDVQSLRLSYNESACWLLIKDLQDGSIKVWVPYIFCDDPVALYTGRQVYGFPKEMAKVSIDDRKGIFSIDTHTVLMNELEKTLRMMEIVKAQRINETIRGEGSFQKSALLNYLRTIKKLLTWSGLRLEFRSFCSLLFSRQLNFIFVRNDFDITSH